MFTVTPAGMMIFPLPCALTVMLPLMLMVAGELKVKVSPLPMKVALPSVRFEETPPQAALNVAAVVPGKSTSQFCADTIEEMHCNNTAQPIASLNLLWVPIMFRVR